MESRSSPLQPFLDLQLNLILLNCIKMFRSQSLTILILTDLLCVTLGSRLFLDGDAYGLNTFQLLDAIPRPSERDLTKRDVCTDAIPGTVSQTCTPGNTLCCLYTLILSNQTILTSLGVPNNTDIAFPQCQTLFGAGFCCVSDGGACYQDT